MSDTKITYKIVVDPKDFNTLVCEITVRLPLGNGISKRYISEEELSTWTKVEFLSKMEKSGYGNCASSITDKVTFCDEV